MIFRELRSEFLVVLLALAASFGAIAALIGTELRRRYKRHLRRRSSGNLLDGYEESERRRLLVGQLIAQYSGVHSPQALSDFLNGELERRHELWRVRVPSNGPGEIYNLER